MLTSLALILLCGMVLGSLFKKLRLPSLVGMIVTGVVLGPYALNLLDDSILMISPDLRQLALIIILTRAGLSLDLDDLKKVGRPALLMCFVPACFEIVGIVLLAPPLLGVSYTEAAVMGAVVAAVSPAVIVPRMLRLMEEGYGTARSIPQLILAGASVDDIFVIVLFASFVQLEQGQAVFLGQLASIPISIVLGLAGGIICGFVLSRLFAELHMRDSVKVVILLSVSFLLIALEHAVADVVAFSGLLAVMAAGAAVLQQTPAVAKRLSAKFSKLWVGAEIILFVLVGATVDIRYAAAAGGAAALVIVGALVLRMLGVLVCVVKTRLVWKERVFCMLAYLPKATVQAAIGAIPLTMGLACGQTVLTVAVLAIVITAPLGALAIDRTYRRLLTREQG